MYKPKHVVRGLSPKGVDHEWSGCGWVDLGRGHRYTEHEAERVVLDANISQTDFIVYRALAGSPVHD